MYEDDNVADIGANMGYYTIWMSKFVRNNGTIHSFEPDNENFKKLTNNCKLNNLTNVKLNKVALSDQDGTLSFTEGLDGESHISLSDSKGTINITSQRLDTYCEQNRIKKFSYLKVDIEGFEYFFLKGANNLLKAKSIDIIQIEINQQVKNSSTTIHNLLDLICDYGYEICNYDCKKKELFKVDYSKERENYFLIANLKTANERLMTR